MHDPGSPTPPAVAPAIAALEARLVAAERDAARLAEVEQDLLAQKNLLRTVLDESPDFIVLKDHAGDFLLGNKPVAAFYGTTPEAMVGKHDGDFSATPEQAALFRENVLGIMARGKTEIVYEDSTDDATGETRHFRSIKKPFVGADGKPQILVIAHDITDVVRAQETIRANERRLNFVLEVTGEGMWDWHVPTGSVAHNTRWLDLLGHGPDEPSNTMDDFVRCLLPEELPGIQDALGKCLRGETPYVHEHRMRRKDGGTIWVLDRGDVVERGPDGAPLRMVGSFADITARKLAEERTEQLNANLECLVNERTRELQDANRALEDTLQRLRTTQQQLVEREKLAALGGLVAGVAHEINTPIGVAVTATSLWQEKSLATRAAFDGGTLKRSDLHAFLDLAAQLAEVTAANLGRASELVSNFKQVAVRQSSDEVELFSLVEAVRAAVASVAPEWKRTSVTVEVEGDAEVRMRASPGFVFQVVSNLVVNALRHAFPGGQAGVVRFTVDRLGHEAVLRYVDNGVGASPEVIARVFEPFFTTRRGQGGTGLGLHIVWNLITGQLGGRVEAASVPGQGFVLTMYLPCLRVGAA